MARKFKSVFFRERLINFLRQPINRFLPIDRLIKSVLLYTNFLKSKGTKTEEKRFLLEIRTFWKGVLIPLDCGGLQGFSDSDDAISDVRESGSIDYEPCGMYYKHVLIWNHDYHDQHHVCKLHRLNDLQMPKIIKNCEVLNWKRVITRVGTTG